MPEGSRGGTIFARRGTPCFLAGYVQVEFESEDALHQLVRVLLVASLLLLLEKQGPVPQVLV